MYQLFTLGRVDLRRSDGSELRSVLKQPKRIALLCYLALSRPPGFHRRDTLLALFWPECGEERARAALRQALYFLHQRLGDGVILRRGKEEVGLDARCLWADAAAFEAALACGRREDALDLFGGELLKGFHLSDAPEFESWLEAERARLTAAARQAAKQLLERAELEGDMSRAVRWAQRAMALAPDDEDTLRRLMTLLDRAGDRVGALREYKTFAQRLRVDYELDLTPETTGLAERLRSRGPSRETSGAAASVVPPATAEESAAEMGPPPWARLVAGTVESRRSLAGRTSLFAGSVLLIATALTLVHPWNDRAADPNLESGLVAVVPFRVVGSNPDLAPLGEGMVDLLATKLTGEGGARAVEPQTILSAWRRALAPGQTHLPRDSALTVARAVGAGELLLGSVVATAGEVTLTASLLDVASGGARAEASVRGPVDSLLSLVDHLAAQVLSLQAAIEGHRLAALTSTSLPALRAYLAGRSEYRRGRFVQAAREFRQALELDSTFALAALGLHYAAGWGPGRFPPQTSQRAERLAWAARDRLSERDRVRLLARFGARYPNWTSPLEQVNFLERSVSQVRDDPELWYALGNALFHAGAVLAIPDWRSRAAAALRRALELDPSFYNPQNHLRQLAVEAGDTLAIRRLGERTLAQAEVGAIRWILAVTLGDSAALQGMRRARFQSLDEQDLARMVYESQSFGIALEDGELALEVLRERAASEAERDRAHRLRRIFALNRGRPSEAARAMAAVTGSGRGDDFRRERVREVVYDAVYWDGDSAAASAGVSHLELRLDRPLPASESERVERLHDLCAVEQWRIWRGDLGSARASSDILRTAAAPVTAEREGRRASACAAVLDAIVASDENPVGATDAIARLDSMLIAAVSSWAPEDAWLYAGTLVAARLWMAGGHPERALAAVRRRGEPGDQVIMLAPFLREEGRLAARSGDPDAAVRAYKHYLLLRSESEPALRRQVDSVRAELAALEGVSGGR